MGSKSAKESSKISHFLPMDCAVLVILPCFSTSGRHFPLFATTGSCNPAVHPSCLNSLFDNVLRDSLYLAALGNMQTIIIPAPVASILHYVGCFVESRHGTPEPVGPRCSHERTSLREDVHDVVCPGRDLPYGSERRAWPVVITPTRKRYQSE
jgi:hypothetical protein